MQCLIDGNWLATSIHYGSIKKDEHGNPGDRTLACGNFVERIHYLKHQLPDVQKWLICWDHRLGALNRKQMFADYKANRKPDADRTKTLNECQEAAASRFDCITAPEGFEADDVIGTLASKYDGITIIHSIDSDMCQLLEDKKTTILEDSSKSLDKFRWHSYSMFVEKNGYGPDRVVDAKCIAGDSADNIKGAKGFGQKAASKIITSGQPLEKICPDEMGFTKPQKKEWPAFLERLPMLRELITIRKDLQI